MKPSEAIKLIEKARFGSFPYPAIVVDAFNMAISALEFMERYDQFWEEVKIAGMQGKEVEIHHSGRVFKIREVAQ